MAYFHTSIVVGVIFALSRGITTRTTGNTQRNSTDDQYRRMLPHNLSAAHVARLLDDAYSCLPIGGWTEIPERLKVMTSDFLQCAAEDKVETIAAGAAAFVKVHPHGDALVLFLEPLVFRLPNRSPRWPMAPWQDKEGKLVLLDDSDLMSAVTMSTGQPDHRYLLETPLPKFRRNDLSRFRKQIVKESSRWSVKDN